MHIRPTTREDVYRVAEIGTAGFATDPLFDTICPGHTTHRQDFLKSALARHKLNLVSPGIYCFVCVSDARDGPDHWNGTEEILGYAVWIRKGDVNARKAAGAWQQHQTWEEMLERALMGVEQTYADVLRLDRSIDRAARAEYDKGAERVFDKMGENWYLASLVTSIDHLRRGVASLLIDWGLQTARLEGIPVALMSSTVGEIVYRKKGFKMVDWVDGPIGMNHTGVMIKDDLGEYVRPAEGEEESWVYRRGENMPIEVVWK